jgi:hypothetical protein
MRAHLLGPLGVAAVPGGLAQAGAEYQAAREDREKALRCPVPRAAETTVLPSLGELRSPVPRGARSRPSPMPSAEERSAPDRLNLCGYHAA